MLSAGGPFTKELEVKEADHVKEVLDVTEPAALPARVLQMAEAMGKLLEEMYPVCSFRKVYFKELVDEQELIHGVSLLNSAELLLSDSSYNVRSGREYANSYYNVLTFDGMSVELALRKRVVTPGTYGHMFCSAIQLGQEYKMM